MPTNAIIGKVLNVACTLFYTTR